MSQRGEASLSLFERESISKSIAPATIKPSVSYSSNNPVTLRSSNNPSISDPSYKPINNPTIAKYGSSLLGKYTNATQIRLFIESENTPIFEIYNETTANKYKQYSILNKEKSPNGEENSEVSQGKKFSGKPLKNKASMIANIIATNRFLERNNIVIKDENGKPDQNNINQLALDRYFEENYTMTKKRALHNIISNVLLKENIRPGRQKLMENIIDKLVEKYGKENGKPKQAVLDSIIYIIDKLLLFNIKSNNTTNPRTILLNKIEKANLGEAKTFIEDYIKQAKENAGNKPVNNSNNQNNNKK
jgi:hypothetical protein